MFAIETAEKKIVDRAMVVGVRSPDEPESAAAEHLHELEELVRNLEIEVALTEVVKLRAVQVHYYVGSGRAAEIAAAFEESRCDILVFDAELTPSQQRNWERLVKHPVVERREIILDIFAQRAITQEARLQVELAQLEYSLPRLKRAWTHLSRQQGGARGTRGEGEKQIEYDRRFVQKRIASLKIELEEVRRRRATMRKSRQKSPVPKAAIVGYTNVGKSSLLNALGGETAPGEDKLFATLDPATRRVGFDGNAALIMTDTVGFVRKLPHTLVAAFKSTLEEAVFADFLVVVLDVSSEYLEEHWETTIGVLSELGAADKEMVVVFNKCDLPHDETLEARARGLFSHGLFISVRTGRGLDELRAELARLARRHRGVLAVTLPPERSDLAALAHRCGEVLEEKYDEAGNLSMIFSIGARYEEQYEPFRVKDGANRSGRRVTS